MKTPLHKARLSEGLTLEELAKAIGSSRSTIHRVEVGEQIPSGSLCLALTERYQSLGLKLEHLIQPELFPDFSITKK